MPTFFPSFFQSPPPNLSLAHLILSNVSCRLGEIRALKFRGRAVPGPLRNKFGTVGGNSGRIIFLRNPRLYTQFPPDVSPTPRFMRTVTCGKVDYEKHWFLCEFLVFLVHIPLFFFCRLDRIYHRFHLVLRFRSAPHQRIFTASNIQCHGLDRLRSVDCGHTGKGRCLALLVLTFVRHLSWILWAREEGKKSGWHFFRHLVEFSYQTLAAKDWRAVPMGAC